MNLSAVATDVAAIDDSAQIPEGSDLAGHSHPSRPNLRSLGGRDCVQAPVALVLPKVGREHCAVRPVVQFTWFETSSRTAGSAWLRARVTALTHPHV